MLNGLDWLLAAVLITQPAGTPCSPEMAFALSTQIKSIAIEWEILDPKEYPYNMRNPHECQQDVEMLRERYADFGDAPPVADCYRLPDRATAAAYMSFNREFVAYLVVHMPENEVRLEEWQQVMNETNRLRTIWSHVDDSRSEFYHISVRRKALKEVRDMIGCEAYYSGNLPPAVPSWRFRKID